MRTAAADVDKIVVGYKIAEVLLLPHAKRDGREFMPVRFETAWGDKTALGLYETVRRIMVEGV